MKKKEKKKSKKKKEKKKKKLKMKKERNLSKEKEAVVDSSREEKEEEEEEEEDKDKKERPFQPISRQFPFQALVFYWPFWPFFTLINYGYIPVKDGIAPRTHSYISTFIPLFEKEIPQVFPKFGVYWLLLLKRSKLVLSCRFLSSTSCSLKRSKHVYGQ